MWPILGPIEYNQTYRSTNFNNVQRSLFGVKSLRNYILSSPYEIHSKNKPSLSIIIKSNIRYIDPVSSTCLILYSLILLLLCALPILALNIYLRQAFDTFHQKNSIEIDN